MVSLHFMAFQKERNCVRGKVNMGDFGSASYDNLRLYDLKDTQVPGKHSMVPFLIVPGHHGGVVSCLCKTNLPLRALCSS